MTPTSPPTPTLDAPPVRTIRRISLPLNRAKWAALCAMARAYRAEKNVQLARYHQDAYFAADRSDRTHRDTLVKAGYVSAYHLQARMWKTAIKDGYETVLRQWASLAAALKPLIKHHEQWSEPAKHYAYWLIFTPRRMAQLVSGRAPSPTHFSLPATEQRQVRNYLRRVIRRKRGARPVAKTARSMAFDGNMYQVFDKNGRQYMALMSQTPYQRIVIPLTGHTPITGNLRVVLDTERQRVEIHFTAPVKAAPALTGEPCGLDAGLTEVFTDERGQRYGTEFGQVLGAASDELCDTGRKRNKLYEIARRAEERGDRAKARRIRKFNLGRKKQQRRARRCRAEVERQINTAINQVIQQRQPALIATEQLDIRGKAKSKRLARRVSLWARTALSSRTEFKASAEGFRRQQVNPAYSSQTCPACGCVDAGNRRADVFHCRSCGHRDEADRVAAINLKARAFDSEIRLWTPKARVKELLLGRFNARLESGGAALTAATVSGQTPGASGAMAPRLPESETSTAIDSGRENGGAKSG